MSPIMVDTDTNHRLNLDRIKSTLYRPSNARSIQSSELVTPSDAEGLEELLGGERYQSRGSNAARPRYCGRPKNSHWIPSISTV